MTNFDPFDLREISFNYKIINKEGMLIPLQFNVYQAAMDELWRKLEHDNLPVRIIVLKPRQTGISTWCQAKIYNQTSTNFFQKATVVADVDRSTTNLFNMSKRFWEYSAPDMRPMRQNSNEKALLFGNPSKIGEDRGLQSQIYMETAGQQSTGRSSTNQHLHCSE